MFERSGFRPVELIIGSLVGIIGLCYLIEQIAETNYDSPIKEGLVRHCECECPTSV
jgi:hypothetical protein